jgi:hypothetical protein
MAVKRFRRCSREDPKVLASAKDQITKLHPMYDSVQAMITELHLR